MAAGPAQATTFRANGASKDGVISIPTGSSARLMGVSWRETAGGAASFRLVDAATSAGGLAANEKFQQGMASGGSGAAWFGPEGITLTVGLSLVVLAGTFDITIWTAQ